MYTYYTICSTGFRFPKWCSASITTMQVQFLESCQILKSVILQLSQMLIGCLVQMYSYSQLRAGRFYANFDLIEPDLQATFVFKNGRTSTWALQCTRAICSSLRSSSTMRTCERAAKRVRLNLFCVPGVRGLQFVIFPPVVNFIYLSFLAISDLI